MICEKDEVHVVALVVDHVKILECKEYFRRWGFDPASSTFVCRSSEYGLFFFNIWCSSLFRESIKFSPQKNPRCCIPLLSNYLQEEGHIYRGCN